MGDLLLLDIVVHTSKVEAYGITYYIYSTPCPYARPEVHLVGIEAIASVCGIAGRGVEVDALDMILNKRHDILLTEHDTLRHSRGATGIEQYECLSAIIGRGIALHILTTLLRI